MPGLVYLGYRLAAWVSEHLPLGAGNRIARAGGALAYRLARGKRAVVRRNLARVVGGESAHLEDLVRAAFASYARYWLETFRGSRYSREELLALICCDTTPVIKEALAEGRGLVVVTAHFGFYDLGVAWMGSQGFPMTTVAEVLKPRALFEWFASSRARRGWPVIPARPAAEARRRLVEIVESGEAVALLSDRDLGRRGVWVELFGERTTIPAFPAVLVARTGAALISGSIYALDGGFQIDFRRIPYEVTGDEPADVEAIAQTIARAVEQIVQTAPEQWHLFSTNWPSDEPGLPPRGGGRTEGAGG
jgi:lauroyl/myristoyl acyltransferase